MDRELGLLFLAFLPGIGLVVAEAISAVRQYGIVFLWCLRFEPVHEKLTSMMSEMHPTEAVVAEPEDNIESEPTASRGEALGGEPISPAEQPDERVGPVTRLAGWLPSQRRNGIGRE